MRWVSKTIFCFVTVVLAAGCGESNLVGGQSGKAPANDPPSGGGGESLGTPGVEPAKDPAGGTVGTLPTVEVAAEDRAKTPVFVFLGGYTSCVKKVGAEGDPLTQILALTFFEQIRPKLLGKVPGESAFLIACYTSDFANARFVVSSQKDKIKLDDPAGLVEALEALTDGLENPLVYIVGHSYGGWTAMYLANELDDRVRIGGLVTLDPISKVDCTPDQFLSGTLGLGDAEACRRAPTDFGAEGLARIMGRTPVWLNYYQTQVKTLHSGEIAGARNVLREYPFSGFRPHNEFPGDPEIATGIAALIDASWQTEANPGAQASTP